MKNQGLSVIKNNFVESVYTITKTKTVSKDDFTQLVNEFSGNGYWMKKGSYVIDCYQFTKPTTVKFTLINENNDTVDFHIQHLEVYDYVNKVYTVKEKKFLDSKEFKNLRMVYETSNFCDFLTYKRSGYVNQKGEVIPSILRKTFPGGVKLEEVQFPERQLEMNFSGKTHSFL